MFEPMAAATRAIQLARAGTPLYFEDGPVGDIERDALAEGLPLWLEAKAGHLYLAANASWPGLFKLGCTRRSIASRMRSLSGAGVPTPWVAAHTWTVHDAHGLEALVHRECEQWRVEKELFHAPVTTLIATVDSVVAREREALTKELSLYLPQKFMGSLQSLTDEQT
jgi:hypothetical protein